MTETIGTSVTCGPTVGQVGKPTLSDDAAARVVATMRELKRERFKGNGAALGRALKIAQPTISDLENRKHKPSFATAQRVAELAGMDVWDLLGEGRGRASEVTHPNLYAALSMVAGRAPEVAKERVRAAAAHLPDLAAGTWLSMLMDEAHVKGRAPRASPSSERDPPPRTMELPTVPKKGA